MPTLNQGRYREITPNYPPTPCRPNGISARVVPVPFPAYGTVRSNYTEVS